MVNLFLAFLVHDSAFQNGPFILSQYTSNYFNLVTCGMVESFTTFPRLLLYFVPTFYFCWHKHIIPKLRCWCWCWTPWNYLRVLCLCTDFSQRWCQKDLRNYCLVLMHRLTLTGQSDFWHELWPVKKGRAHIELPLLVIYSNRLNWQFFRCAADQEVMRSSYSAAWGEWTGRQRLSIHVSFPTLFLNIKQFAIGLTRP